MNKFILFPVHFQFKPVIFNSLSELESYANNNSICLCLEKLPTERIKFLCKRWSISFNKNFKFINCYEGF